MKYQLTAMELLDLFGYNQSVGKEKLEQFEKENNIKLPSLLFHFLDVAFDAPLLENADIWTDLPHFFYVEIEEIIEDDKEYWEENPDQAKDFSDYYKYYKIPREEWHQHVANYLNFGSDRGAGVVTFAIKDEDLDQDDPVVYMLHEADPLEDWKPFAKSLSSFLMTVVLDALSCLQYNTAKNVLQKKGWIYYDHEEAAKILSETDIDPSQMSPYMSMYGCDAQYRCCYDDKKQRFMIIREEDKEQDVFIISKQ